ncbi:hypothetical protein SPHINGO391_470356 [Sphingomonas aurantiaca]|uniref:Uncharacterized protein n=1 Tax=Sphingomonas aurantiaca TaxID=185949 RepID=A0A5E7ZTF8_9SPHN|nr:hypothetical protein SPHINGO391_470356 [Sphingomonas aurantiaca]
MRCAVRCDAAWRKRRTRAMMAAAAVLLPNKKGKVYATCRSVPDPRHALRLRDPGREDHRSVAQRLGAREGLGLTPKSQTYWAPAADTTGAQTRKAVYATPLCYMREYSMVFKITEPRTTPPRPCHRRRTS